MDKQAPMDDSIGPRNLGIVTSVFVLGLVLFALRMYTRITPTCRLNAADYLLTVAVIAEIITYSLFAAAVANGFGRYSSFITPASSTTILKLLFGIIITGLWVSTFARLSIVFLLLSFTTSAVSRTILYFIAVFQVLTLFASEVFQLLECRPVRAMWEPVPDAECISPAQTWVIGYVFVAISMFSDLALVILPIILIWGLSRTVLERFLVSALMGLSLVATIATLLKVVYMKTYDWTSPDVFRSMMPIFLWCRMEESLIVAAASAPLLKAPIERVLGRFGFPTFHHSVRELDSWDSLRTRSESHECGCWKWPKKKNDAWQEEEACRAARSSWGLSCPVQYRHGMRSDESGFNHRLHAVSSLDPIYLPRQSGYLTE